MPSVLHEIPIELFRHAPELAPYLLKMLPEIGLPAYAGVRLEESELTQVVPAEYRADLVLTLRDAAGKVLAGIIVEVQRSIDARKHFTWPVYAMLLRAQLECPVYVMVLTEDPGVARWAREPFEVGPRGSSYAVLVIGPGEIPWVGEQAEAKKQPELAVLSALAHGNEPGGVAVALSALSALSYLDEDRQRFYADVVLSVLGEAARRAVEEEMQSGKYEYRSEFAKRYFEQGRAEGEAKGRAEGEVKGRAEGRTEGRTEGEARAVLAVLGARGIAVDEELRQRVLGTNDLGRLERWLERAARASSAEDVFADD